SPLCRRHRPCNTSSLDIEQVEPVLTEFVNACGRIGYDELKEGDVHGKRSGNQHDERPSTGAQPKETRGVGSI
ncbi:hypothetical protein V3C99_016052, partial [Haemonchus contortus]